MAFSDAAVRTGRELDDFVRSDLVIIRRRRRFQRVDVFSPKAMLLLMFVPEATPIPTATLRLGGMSLSAIVDATRRSRPSLRSGCSRSGRRRRRR